MRFLHPTSDSMTFVVAIALLSSTALASSAANSAVRTVIAIGNDVGLDHEIPLRWAEHDAVRVKDVFTDLGGVTRARSITLLGKSPRDLERTLLEVKGQVAETKRRGERAEVFLSYSGHGDDDSIHLGNTALSISVLLSWIDDIGADAVVVVLDSCRTGPVRAGARRGFTTSPAFDVTLVESPAPVGRVVFKSASQGEVAQESDDLEGAFFTHHLLAGLRGAADGDRDGAVTLTELWRYAHGRTVDLSFGRAAVQHPEVQLNLSGQAELVLTRTDLAAAQLVLHKDLVGSFLVVDERTTRVLFEVRKSGGASLVLAVPPRRLRIQWREGARFAIADVTVRRGDRATIEKNAFTLLPRLAGRTRGTQIDPSPWVIGLALVAAPAPTLGTGAIGPALHLERRLWSSPFSLELNSRFTVARTTTSTRYFEELDALATLGVGVEWWTLVGRLFASASAGLHGVGQRATRLDVARLALAQINVDTRRIGATIGPIALVRAGLFAPLFGPLGVEAGFTANARLLSIDGVDTYAVGAGLFAGVATEF